jgi:ribosomal protein S18 acetylase RimI-like enzyme
VPVDAGKFEPSSLVWATDIDVLPSDREVARRADYWVVRSPANPGHYMGNLLLFDRAPEPGDRDRWLTLFAAELPGLAHRTFAWDGVAGELGAAAAEFPDFELERTVGLVAEPGRLTAHPRASASAAVRALAVDDPGWDQVLGLWEAQNREDANPHPADAYRRYAVARLAELRELFCAGRGAWFVAEADGEVVGSLGVVVTEGRARYQAVDVRGSHRRRGIASRLVVEAAQRVTADWPRVESFVIAADADYHALGIYESLGFRRVEQVASVCRWPGRIAP